MARIDKIELNIEGKVYTYNVNVGKAGIFKCHLDWEVAKRLGLENNLIESSQLKEVMSTIRKAYHDFLNSTKKETAYISIVYEANGNYAKNSERHDLYNMHSPFYLRGFAGDSDKLGFDFNLFILEESSTGVDIWYKGRLGQGCVNYNEGDLCDPNTVYKDGSNHGKPKGVLLPFSPEAYETLKKAREGIRSISEILFNFLSQDQDKVIAGLSKGNLLNP